MRIFMVTAFLGAAAALVLSGNSSARDGSDSRMVSVVRDGQQSINPTRNSQNRVVAADKSNTKRLREGTMITDATGHFREDGDGASFVSDTGMEFGALQNLNLERVVRLLKGADEPSSIRWSVTGTVTEYTGRNYILLRRVVYKSATPPPVPDRVTP